MSSRRSEGEAGCCSRSLSGLEKVFGAVEEADHGEGQYRPEE